jgi:hypothetical protein
MRGVLIPKAKQYFDQSMTTVQNTVSSLQQALNSAEKPENKAKIPLREYMKLFKQISFTKLTPHLSFYVLFSI